MPVPVPVPGTAPVLLPLQLKFATAVAAEKLGSSVTCTTKPSCHRRLETCGHELHKIFFTLGDPPSVGLQNHLPDPS
jgi:hypothetical protein